MKKYKWFSLCIAGILVMGGCAAENAEQPVDQDSDTGSESVEVEETREVVWTAEPAMIFSKVQELEAYPVFADILKMEYTGYPQQWNSTDYSGNGLLVQKSGLFGIMDYDGNMLQECTHTNFYHYNMGPDFSRSMFMFDTHYYLAHDYSEEIYVDGLGGAIGAFKTNEYYVENGAYVHAYDYGDGMQYDYSNNTGGRLIAEIRVNGENTGFAVVDTDSSVLEEYEGLEGVFFANGYVTYRENNKIGLIKVGTGKLTEAVYDDAKYFEDGYIPVQKNGRWGFLNEKGEEVSDFIFDYASSVYQGRAAVKLHGVYGILNIDETLKQEIPINEETCVVSEEAQAAAEEAETSAQIIGHAKVNVNDLRIRYGHSTDAELTGDKANSGDEFEVYEVVSDSRYTWYRISEDRWIANDGSWVDFAPAE